MTVRSLETLIRLSTAHAKSRLSPDITEDDAVAADEILRYALYKEVVRVGGKSARDSKRRKLNKPKRGDKGSDEESSDDDEDEDSDDEDDGRGPKRMELPSAAKERKNPARAARGKTAGAASSPAAHSGEGDEEDYMMVEDGRPEDDEGPDEDELAAMNEMPSPPRAAVEQARQVEQAKTPEAETGTNPARCVSLSFLSHPCSS
jgi:DNA replication licensing factor MCM3